MESNSNQNELEQFRKLFIGGLNYKTTEDTLKSYFSKFGEIVDCVVMKDPTTRRSRGFGFVTFEQSHMVDDAQAARPHTIDGREVEPKRAVPREDAGKPEAQVTVKKIFLSGIKEDLEEADVKEYFGSFGNITSVNIVVDKATGKRRGFAFVEFDDYDPVDKIVLRKHMIKGKRIEVKKALSKQEMENLKRKKEMKSFGGGAGRGQWKSGSDNYGGQGGYGSNGGYNGNSSYGGSNSYNGSGNYGGGAEWNVWGDSNNYSNDYMSASSSGGWGTDFGSSGGYSTGGHMRNSREERGGVSGGYSSRSSGPYGGGYSSSRGGGYGSYRR